MGRQEHGIRMTAFKSKAGTPAAADVPLLLYILPVAASGKDGGVHINHSSMSDTASSSQTDNVPFIRSA